MSVPAHSRASLLAAIVVAVLVTLVVPSVARAGTFQVLACDASNVNRSWSAYGDTGLIAADASCLADTARGMKVRNSLRAPGGAPVLAPMGATGGLQAVARPGTVITGLHADATAYDEYGSSGIAGWRVGIRANGNADVWCGLTQQRCAWVGPPSLRIDLPLNAASVQLAAICHLTSGCQRDAVRAAATLKNVTLDVRDDWYPNLVVAGGALWGAGPWLHGSAGLAVEASDNAGVRRLDIEAGTLTVGTRALPCDPYSMMPCPEWASFSASIDTARLPDGPTAVLARVVDSGGNVHEERSTVLIDNVAPSAGAPVIRGGSGWRAANAFELEVDARDGERGSGVRGISWELCRVAGGGCVTHSADGSPRTLAVRVPGVGEWRARVWARDAVREGARGPWSEPLRFDDGVPGPAAIDAGAGWSRGEASSQVVIRASGTAPAGPSGIAGFAVSRGDAVPGSVATHRGERVLVDLGELPEGPTRVRARAISGAGVASAQVGEALVRIDRTPPAVQLSTDGAPLRALEGEWLRRGVRLTAHATDQAYLSGMTLAAEGEPLTRGAYLEYQVDDAPPVRVRAAATTLELPDDGLRAVTVRAVDAAGNVSDPQRATFRVDRSQPTGTVERIDHTAPRRLRAAVAEECIADAALELRADGSREWKTYPARAERRAVTGDVPDDRLPAGEYAARFRVRDCAGNTGFAYHGSASDLLALRLPLRDSAVLDAGITAGVVRGGARARVRPGASVLVRGQLKTLDGRYLAGRRVEFQERIGDGEWRLRAVRVSDDSGRVAATLPPGPSRRIRLVVADTEQTIGASSRALAVSVPARATLRASRSRLRNGEAVRFSGRVLGGFVPRTGRELELQGFNPLRGRWQPVRTQGLRTSRHGRFATTYRFTATVGTTVTYRFRVRVAPRPDHPFAEGFSRTVRVTVSG